MPRRSISQSLTAREIEFIKAPLVEAKSEASAPQTPETKKTSKQSKPPSVPAQSSSAPYGKPQATTQPTGSQDPWVTITTRLPNQLHSRLRRAAFERSERGQEPNTIQDILATAATSWLDKNE